MIVSLVTAAFGAAGLPAPEPGFWKMSARPRTGLTERRYR